MEERSTERQIQGQEERQPGRLVANWRSCTLLVVMVLGLVATPLAIVLRWYSEGSNSELAALLRQEGHASRIAYITPRGQLATIAPDGSHVRLLSDEENISEFPAWSPDGKLVAVVGDDKVLLVPTDSDLDRSGGGYLAYDNSEEAPFYLYWSPDSQYVGFLTSHPEGIALRLAQRGGAESESDLIAIGQPFYWDWAPTADKLFIHSGGSSPNSRLEMVDLRGDSAAEEFGPAGIFQAPGISESGRFRAFAALDEEGRSRLVIQDGNGDSQQFEVHFGQLAMTWSPATDLLAYRSPRLNGRFNGGPLRLVDPSTGKVVLLSNENVLAFFWSPDGHTIAYVKLPRENDGSVRVAADIGKESYRARSQRQQDELRMELWVVDVESGHQRRLTQFVPTSHYLRQFLPYFDQYALSHRVWSPNSDALVISVFEEGRSQIAVVPLSGGPARLIADGVSASWSQQ